MSAAVAVPRPATAGPEGVLVLATDGEGAFAGGGRTGRDQADEGQGGERTGKAMGHRGSPWFGPPADCRSGRFGRALCRFFVGGYRRFRVTFSGSEAKVRSDAGETPPDDLPKLMKLYQAGDGAAFEEIYGRLARPMRGYLRTIAPPGMDVEDLVQNTFLQIHRSRQSYLPGEPVRPWVFAIARHVGLMARRSSGRRLRREVQPTEDLPEVPVLARAAGALDRIALGRALHTLAEPGREALWLHHVEGFSFREVAAVQGVSETAAKVRAHRAMVALRGGFAEAGS
jgi:RNA polymerase sigma-70 factor, ECF subfamily